MEPVRPEFVPDPALSREDMEALQRDIADAALFEDDLDFDPAVFERGTTAGDGTTAGVGTAAREGTAPEQATLTDEGTRSDAAPLVAGVDQAFVGDLAVSAIVLMRDGEVIDRAVAALETEIPYIPGLLSFREGGAILAAFAEIDVEPDVAFVDGSGRIHYREAGLATHIGVTLDLPAIGVAKSLLCGEPAEPLDEKRPEGTRVAITADERVETAVPGTTIGYAVQTRQYESGNRHVNPLFVSPGHRVGAATAADLVEATCAGYKLPEPTRQADAYADEAKRRFGD